MIAFVGGTGSASLPTGQAELIDGTTPVGTIPIEAQSVDAQGVAVFYLPALAAGPHQFTVVYSGDASYAASQASTSPITVVDTSPPTVASVVRSGSAKVATATVVISFVGPLNPPNAQAASNYRVTTAGGQVVRVKSATYDATADAVTLHLASRLGVRATYRLRITGTSPAGVEGSDGVFLAGSGSAGTTYQGTIPRATTVATKQVKARAVAATHPQGHLATQHHAASRSVAARSTR